nr:putative enoyl-CoA hydratase/isomerase [uncultured bacterium]
MGESGERRSDMEERVSLEVRDAVAHVTLTRADKYNGVDLDMLEALVRTAAKIGEDRGIRAVIVGGEGKAFCAGLDFATVGKEPLRVLRSFLTLPRQSTNLFQKAIWCWRELPVPVLAVTHGYCYGAGMQLALAADFRFTTPDCEFSIMEAKWGLIPDMTGTVTLRELLPMDVAMRLTMTGEAFDGLRAKELGLVTEVAEDPLAAAEKLVAELVTRSPDSVAATKALFHRTRHVSPQEAFGVERRIQRKLLMGRNHKIARKANLAKQPPRFAERGFDG